MHMAVAALIGQKRATINWLIRIELLTGALTAESYRELEGDLSALRQLELTNVVFQTACVLRWQLQRRGVTIPLVDVLIAACAIHYDCTLLHDDHHFRLLARHTPLKLYPLHT